MASENNFGKVLQENDQPSYGDQALSFAELMKEKAFLGELSIEVILEGIEKQFDDYINLRDKANYVDIFYDQLDASYQQLMEDESDDHKEEIREILSQIYQSFVDKMEQLLEEQLTISIPELSSGTIHPDDLQFIFRRLYEFFILDAANNFKKVITADLIHRMAQLGEMEDDSFFQAIDSELEQYTPLLSKITPTQFLQYRGDGEMSELWENGRVAGNFLRKYSPKLYQNEEFTVSLVNHITMVYQFKDAATIKEEESVAEEDLLSAEIDPVQPEDGLEEE